MPGLASKKEKKTQQNGAETGAERAGGGRKVKLDKANGAKGEREREREKGKLGETARGVTPLDAALRDGDLTRCT